MITEKDLQEAIAECKGQRNPNASTCIKLAAFYTILDHINDEPEENTPTYSFAQDVDTVTYTSDSEFAHRIYGRRSDDIWAVMDELMDTLQVLNPNLYAGVLRKIHD